MISCTKGILNDTLETVNQIMERALPPAFHSRLAYLSGPSFAAEVRSLLMCNAGSTGNELLECWAHPMCKHLLSMGYRDGIMSWTLMVR